MAIVNTQTTVGTTAVPIVAANPDRTDMFIVNVGAATVYLGDAAVASGTGYALAANAALQLRSPDPFRGALYAVMASGTADVRVLEV